VQSPPEGGAHDVICESERAKQRASPIYKSGRKGQRKLRARAAKGEVRKKGVCWVERILSVGRTAGES